MDKKLKRRLDLLTGYAVFSLIIFGYIIVTSFTHKDKHQRLDKLTVKRINIVGEDGSLRMVISNETRQHSGRSQGQNLPQRKRPAGIIFFDTEGNECGGLVYGVSRRDDKVTNGMSFTMDNYNNDQAIQIINAENYTGGKADIRRGIAINEYPVGGTLLGFVKKYEAYQKISDSVLREQKIAALEENEGLKRRLFIGRTKDNLSGLFLYDTAGKPKLEIYVDSTGKPQIKVLDNRGESTNVLLQ